jgi:hypothetical protein
VDSQFATVDKTIQTLTLCESAHRNAPNSDLHSEAETDSILVICTSNQHAPAPPGPVAPKQFANLDSATQARDPTPRNAQDTAGPPAIPENVHIRTSKTPSPSSTSRIARSPVKFSPVYLYNSLQHLPTSPAQKNKKPVPKI